MPANLYSKMSLSLSRLNSVHATAVLEPCWQKEFNLYVSNAVEFSEVHLSTGLQSYTAICRA